MQIRTLTLLLGLLAAPASLEAQQPPRPRAEAPARAQRPGPVELLLRNRARVGLSDAQVATLREIRAETERLNRPLLRRLVEIRRAARGGGRDTREAGVAEARPLVQRIREQNVEAMRRVGEVLTDEQKRRVREMLETRRRRGRGRGPGG